MKNHAKTKRWDSKDKRSIILSNLKHDRMSNRCVFKQPTDQLNVYEKGD